MRSPPSSPSVSVIVFLFGRWVRHLPFVEVFQAVVSIAVSVIPEGLPALITVTLAIGVQRDGQTQYHHPAPPGGRDPWIGIPNLLRQDGYADAHGDDGSVGSHG